MKEKIKRFGKRYLIGFITGIVVCGTVSVIAMAYFPSNDVTYENTASGLSSTNVQGAIDELYKICTEKPPATDTITDLLPSNPDELYEDEHGDIRYYGKNPNNYVNFNNELWRIMGVIDGKVKIIRNESIGRRYWDLNDSDWKYTLLKEYLNGEYYNSIDETYKNMISKAKYYLGGPTSDNYTTLTASGYYNAERDSSQISIKQYIGLMYPSDYGYAAGSSCLSTTLWNYGDGCQNSDYLYNSGEYEWLQAPNVSDSFYATLLVSTGRVNAKYSKGSPYEVHPVLYLSSDVKITSGDGSQNNPFQLS